MKKKILIIMIMCIMCFATNVNAASSAEEGQSNYSTLKTSYEKGITKVNVATSDTGKIITLYGQATCSGSGCTNKYANGTDSFEKALAATVVCTGGEEYLSYENAGSGKDAFGSSSTYKGTAYWSEDYSVKCTSSASSSSISTSITDSTSGTTTTKKVEKTTTAKQDGNTTTTTKYNSSSTVDTEETGVNTYFLVLGIIALVSYALIICIKKYNLFKSV